MRIRDINFAFFGNLIQWIANGFRRPKTYAECRKEMGEAAVSAIQKKAAFYQEALKEKK